MKLPYKTAVVTGGGRGIGRALARRFAAAGARVVVADRLAEPARRSAAEIGGLAVECDVSDESSVCELVERAEGFFGPVELFCSNAGVAFGEPGGAASASDEVWQSCWEIHVMAHVYAARAVLPGMLERGGGCLVQMASAAGLLSQIGDAAYSASKHAAVGFAESLAISHGDDNIQVALVCPQYVASPMLGFRDGESSELDGVLSPDQVADAVVAGIVDKRFLILPHPQVEKYMQFKTADYQRWLEGMRKLRRRVVEQTGGTRLEDVCKLI